MHYWMGRMITCLNLGHNHKMFDFVFSVFKKKDLHQCQLISSSF
jgi:hypothetical protein